MTLDPTTVAALREHRRRQRQARLALGHGWQVDFTDRQGLSRMGLVWTHADGRPVHPRTFYKRFRKLTTEPDCRRSGFTTCATATPAPPSPLPMAGTR
jgi:hypothetical protein